ncbi:hypothetical protein ACLOJK_030309 [Asimina triloba]
MEDRLMLSTLPWIFYGCRRNWLPDDTAINEEEDLTAAVRIGRRRWKRRRVAAVVSRVPVRWAVVAAAAGRRRRYRREVLSTTVVADDKGDSLRSYRIGAPIRHGGVAVGGSRRGR